MLTNKSAMADPPLQRKSADGVADGADALDGALHHVAGLEELGGSKPMPTPAGVPVAMMVPGSSVIPAVSSSKRAGMPVRKSRVLECCRGSPLTAEEMSSAGGKAISSAVTMQGPMG